MERLYHSSIFYPEELERLNQMTTPLEKKERAKALILPHGDLSKLYPLFQETFSHVDINTKHVIILTPLHTEPLAEDQSEFAFEGICKSLDTHFGQVRQRTLNLKCQESYAEEEFSAEIILPFITRMLSDADISIVYTYLNSGEKAKKFSSLLKKWDNEDTLFIISSNLTGKIKEEELEKEREKAVRLLESGEYLMEGYKRKYHSICATGIIDSYSRINSNSWKLIALASCDTITGHGAFYKL